jgi:hypothetical protein
VEPLWAVKTRLQALLWALVVHISGTLLGALLGF